MTSNAMVRVDGLRKSYGTVEAVRGIDVTCRRGGKEVHAADVAKAAALLLAAPGIAGEEQLLEVQRAVREIFVDDLIRRYIVDLANATRGPIALKSVLMFAAAFTPFCPAMSCCPVTGLKLAQ